MLPLPSVKPNYDKDTSTADWKEASTWSQAEATAIRYGVDKKFIHFASTAYTSEPEEHYGIHKFKNAHVSSPGFDPIDITTDEQYKNALKLLDDGTLWSKPPGVIVINSPYYLFNSTAAEPARGPDGFLAHLLCSLAHRTSSRKAPSVDVNFMELMQLDFSKEYKFNPRHLLVWGPCTNHFNSFDCNKTIQFLFSFRHYTRILLTSTSDLGELLARFHMSSVHASYIFNLDSGIKFDETPKEPKIKKIKEPPIQDIEPKKPKETKQPPKKQKKPKPKKEPKPKKNIGV